MKILDNELDLLEKIYSAEKASSRLTQRELAQSSGLSLGMTNAIIRRFEEDGLIRLTRHSTKSISYSLTAEGLAAISQRAATYIRKATHNVDLYRERLASFIAKKKGEGALTLVLSGASELSPLLETVCEECGLVLVKSADPEKALALGKRPGVILLCAEGEKQAALGAVSLSSIIAGKAPE